MKGFWEGRMIVIKLWGGLGNQLFQYAYGYQLAKKNKTSIILDLSWFQNNGSQEPNILKLNIEYADKIYLTDVNSKIEFWNRKYPNRLLRILPKAIYHIGGYNYLKESRFKYSEFIKTYSKDNTFIDGYWQVPMYFNDYKDDLKELFSIKELDEKILDLGRQMKNKTAIHVRRGDYPKHKLFYSRLLTVSDTYYHSAVDYLEKKGITEFIVFSNDIEDAKSMLCKSSDSTFKTVSFERKLTDLEEWYLMSSCENIIIGNSTFSWWAAYLNSSKNKIVCAPNKYFGNDNIIPKEWNVFDV